MEPLNLELLNKVWNGIKDGTLHHNQETYYCGTSACIAGWICHFAAVEESPYVKNLVGDKENWEDGVLYVLDCYSIWSEAQDLIGLTDDEASLLFDCYAKVKTQEAVIGALNKGQRFEDLSYRELEDLRVL